MNVGERVSAEVFHTDPRRARSGEVDYGVWWTEQDPPAWPWWRVSLIEDTGELYAQRQVEGEPVVELLAEGVSRLGAELVLEGWAERCGGPRSLSWVRSRMASRNPATEPEDEVEYVGVREGLHGLPKVYVRAEVGRIDREVRELRHVVRHSPDGFEWGFGGSGPADLALSILADALGPASRCAACRGDREVDGTLCLDCGGSGLSEALRETYQGFKWDVVAGLPRRFVLPRAEVRRWLSVHLPEVRAER